MNSFVKNIISQNITGLNLINVGSIESTDFTKITHVIIEVSNFCNYKCIMCALQDNPDKNIATDENTGFMDFSLFKKIIDQVLNHTVTLCIQGCGEPMLHPDFFQMIEYIRSKSKDISIWFNTNGSKLDKEACHFLVKNNLTKIYFSLDAATKKTYESIRVGGDWDNVKNNIFYFSEIAKGKINIGVSFVLQKDNMKEKYYFLRKFLPVVNEVIFYNLADKNRMRKKNFDINFAKRPACPLLKEQKYITKDGKVMPCCGALTGCVLGDIKIDSFSGILNSDKYRQMIFNQQNGKFDDCNWCKDCSQWLGSYTVSLDVSPLRRFFELGFSKIKYFYSINNYSEVYTRV